MTKPTDNATTAADADAVLAGEKHIRRKAATGALAALVEDIGAMLSLVKDYVTGEYREIPWWIIASIIAALLYVLNPIDAVPDYIPWLGLLDDAAVVSGCVGMAKKDLERYKAWKQARA